MSVLTVINDAMEILNLRFPGATVTGATDATVLNVIMHANEAGAEIARRGDWSKMLKSANVTAALPADFLRLVPGGAVNVTAPTPAPVRGPLSADQMAAMARMGSAANLYYAIEGGQIVFSAALAGKTVQARYVSRNWLDRAGTLSERVQYDDQETLFPEALLTDAIVWRYRRAHGMDYADQIAEWEARLALELRQDRGVTV